MGAKLSDSGADWDQYEQASGSSNLDRPQCKRCRNLITDDNWRRDSLGYVCSVCDARERQEERQHSHPCSHCQTPVDCGGELEQNYDGWPEVVCRTYHIDRNADVVCYACLRDEDLRHDADMEQNEPEDVNHG